MVPSLDRGQTRPTCDGDARCGRVAPMARKSADIPVGYARLGLVQDIRDAPRDARTVLVSSDDVYLSAGGGVSDALLQLGGDELRAEMDRVRDAAGGRLALGTTVATAACGLGAARVIHATTLDYDEDSEEFKPVALGESELFSRVLDHAVELGADHLVLPLLSTGAAGNPLDVALWAFVLALVDHAAVASRLKRVTLALGGVPESALRETDLEGWLRCAPRVPTLRELAASCPRPMRVGLLKAHGARFGSARIAPLLSAITAGIRVLDGRECSPVDAAERLVERAGGPAKSNLTLDLHAYQGLIATPRLGQLDPAWLGREVRALHRLAASGLFLGELASSAAAYEDVAVSEHYFLRGRLLADATAYRRYQPGTPEALRVSPPKALGPTPRGDTPVGRLADLLIEALDQESLAQLQREARSGDRVGEDREVLVEHLLELDPREPLQYLTLPRLRELAAAHGLSEELPGQERCACAILERLGFTVARPVVGLGQYQRQVADQHARARLAPAHASDAAVEAGKLLERATKQLLTFHCRWAFDGEPDTVAHQRGWLGTTESIHRLPLGKLFELAGRLDAQFERDDEEPGRRFQQLFGRQKLAPPRELASHRNVCAHDRKEGREATEAERRKAAASFLEGALQWLAHLGEEPRRLFPQVIQIRGEQVDEWGRRTYVAVGDRGEAERLHVAEAHTVGATYFMYPRSNPVRVFPLLVRAD